MNLQEAEKIVYDYGKVLETTAHMGPVASISLLPYPKDKIKEAIKLYYFYLKSNNQLDEQIKNTLEVGYAQLACFVENTLGQITLSENERVNKIRDWLNKNKDAKPEEVKEILSQNPHQDQEKYIEILKSSNEEMGKLLKEIDEFKNNLENKSPSQNKDKDLYSQMNVSKVVNSTVTRILLAPFEFLNSLVCRSFLLKIKMKFRNLYGPDDYVVKYEITKFIPNPTVRDLVQLFALYYSKTLYNMAQAPTCGALIKIMRDVTAGDFRDRKNELTEHINNRVAELDKPELLKELKTMEKEYSGKLHGDLNKIEQRYITTDIAWGAENYYLPLSVLVFLSDLMDKLEINDVAALCTCIQGMNDYFDKNSYSKLSDINASVLAGLRQAGLI